MGRWLCLFRSRLQQARCVAGALLSQSRKSERGVMARGGRAVGETRGGEAAHDASYVRFHKSNFNFLSRVMRKWRRVRPQNIAWIGALLEQEANRFWLKQGSGRCRPSHTFSFRFTISPKRRPAWPRRTGSTRIGLSSNWLSMRRSNSKIVVKEIERLWASRQIVLRPAAGSAQRLRYPSRSAQRRVAARRGGDFCDRRDGRHGRYCHG